MKSILIVGYGYLGSYLSEKLNPKDYSISFIKRTKIKTKYKQFNLDVSKEFKLKCSYDYIIYMASPDSFSEDAYEKSYITGLRNTLHALPRESSKNTQIILISSTGVYDEKEGKHIKESDLKFSTQFPCFCLQSCERLLIESPFIYTILRAGGIYGLNRNMMIRSIKEKKARFKASDQIYMNRIHVEDLARMIIFSLANKSCFNEVFNAVDCEPASFNTVLSWTIEKLKMNKDEFERSKKDQLSRRGNKRCSNQKILELGFSFKYFSFREGYLDFL